MAMRWLITGLWLGSTAFAAPTFNRDILPIFQKNCQTCHRPGEIGPMPLLTYTETRPWAQAIKVQVATGKMPPWFADPQYGHFANDRRLSAEDVHQIVSWVDAGAPEGDPKDRPAPVVWKYGWNIRPDEVFQMPDPFPVPAKGVLDYIIVIPTGFKKDVWVTAAEVRPGAPSVVHHVVAFVRPPRSQWMREAKPFVPYIPPMSASADHPQGKPGMSNDYLAGYSPGMQPERFDIDHSARLIQAGSDIVLQLHYTLNGKTAMADQTKLGLTLTEEPPAKLFMDAVAASWNWTIPPGDPNYEAQAKLTFGDPVELLSLQPHMHLRGKDMTIRVIYPSGESETLLSVPHYDFHWQIIYYLKQPLLLPRGTRVEVTAHWDNSAVNPQNSDPAATVRYGVQNTDEMLNLSMDVVVGPD